MEKESLSIRMMHGDNQYSVEWATPQDLFDKLDAEFGFTLDPCCTHENAKCTKHYTQKENGLIQDWSGERVFMNPPYGREIAEWMKKAATSNTLVVALIPARTDTKWFHEWVVPYADIRFIKGRLRFNGHKKDAPFPSIIAIYNAQTKQDSEKHGKWTETKEHARCGENTWEWTNFYCSECDAPSDRPYEFCPYCGAKMDGE